MTKDLKSAQMADSQSEDEEDSDDIEAEIARLENSVVVESHDQEDPDTDEDDGQKPDFNPLGKKLQKKKSGGANAKPNTMIQGR